jgi:hypothetical protein
MIDLQTRRVLYLCIHVTPYPSYPPACMYLFLTLASSLSNLGLHIPTAWHFDHELLFLHLVVNLASVHTYCRYLPCSGLAHTSLILNFVRGSTLRQRMPDLAVYFRNYPGCDTNHVSLSSTWFSSAWSIGDDHHPQRLPYIHKAASSPSALCFSLPIFHNHQIKDNIKQTNLYKTRQTKHSQSI